MHSVGKVATNGPKQPSVRLLTDVSFALSRGERLHVVGPSGAGKSSLVRLINRLDEPSEGDVRVLGRAVDDWPVRELRRRVGMVFQEPRLVGLDVRGNLRLPFELIGDMPDDLEARMTEALDLAGLSADMLDRYADELSVGQKQRVTLARALMVQPEVLILDEPTSSLDPQTAGELLASLAALMEHRELTVAMVTHRLSEARRLGGKLAVLIDGRLTAFGEIEDVLADPGHEPTAAFLKGARDETG